LLVFIKTKLKINHTFEMKNKLPFIIFIIVLFSAVRSFAQWTSPAIDAINDGAGNYPNNYTSGATNWALTWNNTDLYVCITNANQSEPVSIYLDVDPIVPVNGGSNADGTLVGLNYDGYTTRPNLPFRADICIYAHNGYREIFRRDAANGWTSIGGQPNAITGSANDYVSNADGQYSSNDNGNGNGGDDRREFRISWSRLQGAINGGAKPAAFNWMGYISYTNGMYAQVPIENYNGNNVTGNSNGLVRYFTVSNTANGTSTNPFAQNSFTQPLTASNAAFGGITVYDFTMNSNAQTITRSAGGGQAWVITGNLVLADGTISSGTSTTSISTNHIDIRGGTLTLSGSAGGDLNVSGNFSKTSGTFNCNSRQVNFNGSAAQAYSSNMNEIINYLLISNTSATVTSGSSITVPNNLTINAGVNCRLDMGANSLTLTGSSANIINGTLKIGGSSGSIIGMTALNTTFSATGTYEHSYTTTPGTVPTATWNPASNCNIIGYTTSTGPTGGLSQTFGNFTWNCTSQTGAVNLLGGLNGATIAGNFNVLATNSGSLRLTSFASMTLNILGNLNVSGGTFACTNVITPNTPTITLNISGALNITGGVTNFQVPPPALTGGVPTFNVSMANLNISGGTLVLFNATAGLGAVANLNISGNFTQSGGTVNNCSTGAANGIVANWNILGNFNQTAGVFIGASFGVNPEIYLNVYGDFSQSLGATITSGGAFPKCQIEFKGSSNQNVSVSGSTLSNLWWRLNNAAGITLANNITINSLGKFIRTNGAIAGVGSILFIAGSQLKYNGTANMTSTDKEWPVSMSGVAIEIDNPAGINLHASRTVTALGGEIKLTNGSLFLGNNDLYVDYLGNGNYTIPSPSAANMFVTNGTGQFLLSTYVRSGSPVGSDNYVFPIGDNTGVSEYTPVEIRLFKNTVSRIIGLRVVDALNPNINTPVAASDYLSRYWMVSENGAGGLYRDSITVYYTPGDVTGTEANIKFSTFAAGIWSEHGTTVNAGVKLVAYQPSNIAFTQTYLPLNGLEITGRRAPVFTNYTWVGTTSNDYNTASNWSPVGVPTAADNITVGVSSPNPCVINSGSYTVTNFTLNGTGNFQLASGTSITVNGVMIYGGSATGSCNCNSTFNILGTLASTVPPINYGNLNISGGNRTLSNTGTIGICGSYTPGAGVLTVIGSTLNFNGSGAQTVPSSSYYNLTLSNARTTNSITLSGTIDIAGVFNPSATFTSGNYIVTGNTINYNGANGQTIATFNYNNISSTNNSRILQNTGNIGIAGSFTPGTGTYTSSGSTVVFNGTGNQTVPVFNSLTANRSYHHLVIEGTGLYTPSRTWGGAGISNGITGNLTINGGQFEQSTTAGGVNFYVNGDLNLTNANARFSQHAGNFSDNNTYILGNWVQSAGRFDFNTSVVGTGDGFLYLSGNFNATGGLINCTSTGSNTINPTFAFDGTGIQSYSRTAGGNQFVDFVIEANKSVLLLSNFSVNDGDIVVGTNATLDGQGFTVATTDAGASADEFRTNVGSLLRTTNALGIVGFAPSGARNFDMGTLYEFYGTNQNTGFNTSPAITSAAEIIMSLSGTLTNTSAALTLSNALRLNSGVFEVGAANTINLSNGALVAATSGDFITGVNAGTINFIATGSFTGNSNPYQVTINGGVNFGAGTVTIQNGGKLKINAGGFVNTNAPAYAVGATLQYFSSGNYGRGTEWSALSGKGYPYHVQISNNTSLDMGNTTPTIARSMGGDLTVDVSAGLFMDYGLNDMTATVTVKGNVLLAGNLSLSGLSGGDIIVNGNWTRTTGTFTPNGRAVFFQGTAGNQTITCSSGEIFDFVIVNKTVGDLLIANNVMINNILTFNNGNVSIGNNDLIFTAFGAGIAGATASNFIITNGSGKVVQLMPNNGVSKIYPIGPAAAIYAPVTLTQAAAGMSDNIGISVTTAPAYSFAVNDNNQMVNLEWKMNENVAGGNNLSSNFQWPLTSEGVGFIRGSGVFQGDYTGSAWQARASIISGGNPYLSSSSINFIGNLSNRPFVIGNINGIIGCVATVSSGDWHNTSTWTGGNIPPTASTACIGHAVQITSGNTNALSSVTLTAGGSLDIDATRSLIFGTGGLLTNSTGASSSITGLGSIIFNGTGTIAGGNAVTVNSAELNGLTTISTPLTVNGDLILNSGSSVSATPSYGSSSSLIYNTGGSYGVNVEWTGNSNTAGLGVPNNVSIRNNTTLNMPGSDRGQSGTMTIEAGTLNMGTGDLYVNGDWTRHGTNGFFNPNGKAIFFNRTGTQNITITGGGTEIFNYLVIDKPSGSLVLNSSDVTHITVNGSAGNTLQILNTGSLDLNGNSLNLTNAGGSILASGGIRNIISTLANATVNVQASKSVSSSLGGSLVFAPNVKVALSAGMDFGNTLSTIQGTLQIALGGFVTGNAPTYDVGSTLRYFSGSAYGRGLEWSSTSGPGYPYHVDIDQNGTVTTLDLSNGGSALRQMAGNLNLNNGGNLSMGAMSHPLVVKGNVNIGGASSGSLSLSSAAGGDIQIAGNLTRNAGGTFTQNGREVTMNGTALQSISNNISSFDYLNIDNNGASVQINSNTSINNRLKLSNGLYDLNGFTTTMANGSQIRRSASTATMSGAPTINSGDSYDLQYNASMTSGVEFVTCVDCVRDLIISAGTLTLNGNKTINRNLQLAGDLNIVSNTFTFRGRTASSLGSGNIEITSGARTITGTGIFDIIGLGANTPNEYTKVVTNPGAGTLNFGAGLLVKIGDGRMNWGLGNPTTISGILQVATGGTSISNSCYYAVGSTLRFANNVDYQVNSTDLTWAAGAINSGLPGIPWNIEVMDNGTDLNLNDLRALRNDLLIYNGSASFTLNAGLTGSFNIGGNWTRTGVTTSFNHNNKKVVFDKQSAGDQIITANGGLANETFYDVDFQPNNGNIIITGTLKVLNTLNLIAGKVDLNGFELILGQTGSNGTLIGGNSASYLISGSSVAKFTRFTTTTSTTYNFPLGDATHYTPMSVTLNTGSSVNVNAQISMYLIASTHPMIGVPGPAYLSRYWTAEPANFGGSYDYNVSYTYADADIVGIEANLKPYKYHGGTWVSSVGSGFPSNMGTAVVSPGTNTISWNGLTTFSDFTGNGNGSPLPISLLDFDAVPLLENVLLTWTTASETNNDFFTLERSQDGVHFDEIITVDGAGNSNQILQYKSTDFTPLNGTSYYRLKQTDFDGKFDYSNLKAVNFNKPIQTQLWSIFPNPTNLNGVYIKNTNIDAKQVTLKIIDLTGKVIKMETINNINANASLFVGFENISTGMYMLELNDEMNSTNTHLIINSK
jgi:hypothetical protein